MGEDTKRLWQSKLDNANDAISGAKAILAKVGF